MSHGNWDHIRGFQFFAAYVQGKRIRPTAASVLSTAFRCSRSSRVSGWAFNSLRSIEVRSGSDAGGDERGERRARTPKLTAALGPIAYGFRFEAEGAECVY